MPESGLKQALSGIFFLCWPAGFLRRLTAASGQAPMDGRVPLGNIRCLPAQLLPNSRTAVSMRMNFHPFFCCVSTGAGSNKAPAENENDACRTRRKKKMNSDKMEISFENLEKVSGGTIEEARAYVEELAKKYGTRDGLELNRLVTKEELEHLKRLLNH